jgi:hypothetical protein
MGMERREGRVEPLIDLGEILRGLAEVRRVFHSEADLQHALAMEISRSCPGSEVRPEYPMYIKRDGKHVYLDLWFREEGLSHAIELKYKTRSMPERLVDGEEFLLLDQSAQNIARYAFCNDIHRLETIVSENTDVVGHAIFLSNDRTYWERPIRRITVDRAFRLTDGRTLGGPLDWGASTSDELRSGMEGFTLGGSYDLTWTDYSEIGSSTYGRFRFLLVDIQ